MTRIVLILVCIPIYWKLSVESAACPNYWIPHGNSCYKFSHDHLPWTDSFTMCKILGGMLAEVDSEDEKTFLDTHVHGLQRGDYWIGGHDNEEEGVFVWATSRHVVTIEHFSSGQPDDASKNENCLEIFDTGFWNDLDCNTQRSYICERESNTEAPVIG